MCFCKIEMTYRAIPGSPPKPIYVGQPEVAEWSIHRAEHGKGGIARSSGVGHVFVWDAEADLGASQMGKRYRRVLLQQGRVVPGGGNPGLLQDFIWDSSLDLGASQKKMPGRTSYTAIVLEAGAVKPFPKSEPIGGWADGDDMFNHLRSGRSTLAVTEITRNGTIPALYRDVVSAYRDEPTVIFRVSRGDVK